MSGHTPGEWFFEIDDEFHDASLVSNGEDAIATVWTGKADAALIAAAPEAIEAARALIAWADAETAGPDYGTQTRDTHPDGEAIWRRWWDEQGALYKRAVEAARAAIAKAEGEE